MNNKKQNILGIDFGLKHVGLATSEGILASPLVTLKNDLSTIAQLEKIIKIRKINQIIIGISERQMAQQTQEFGQKLKNKTNLPIIFWDETLTSREATEKMVGAGKAKKDRQKDQHQFAACLILQDYLDCH